MRRNKKVKLSKDVKEKICQALVQTVESKGEIVKCLLPELYADISILLERTATPRSKEMPAEYISKFRAELESYIDKHSQGQHLKKDDLVRMLELWVGMRDVNSELRMKIFRILCESGSGLVDMSSSQPVYTRVFMKEGKVFRHCTLIDGIDISTSFDGCLVALTVDVDRCREHLDMLSICGKFRDSADDVSAAHDKYLYEGGI